MRRTRSVRRRSCAVLALLMLGGCAGPSAPVVGGDPLVDPPGMERRAEPTPRAEPRSRAGNRSPYMVLGKTYHVMPTAAGYRAEGVASWYGRKFHGRRTANGERYDMFAFSAAHRSLPLPTWLRVTNLDNGRSVTVRVNDRGPFHDERIIDLSYAAAKRLGFAAAGTAPVRLEALSPRAPGPREAIQTAQAAAAREARDASSGGSVAGAAPAGGEAGGAVGDGGSGAAAPVERAYWLQAGVFGDSAAAQRLKHELERVLRDRGAAPVRLSEAARDRVRVRIGPLADLDEANRLQALLMFSDVVPRALIVRE